MTGTSDWPRVELGSIAIVSWGDTSTTKAAYVEEGYPAYSATGKDGYLPYADHDRPGVVLSAIGANSGKTWLATGQWSCIKNTMWFRSANPDVRTEYLYYATGDPSRWPKRGAAQPFIALADARRLEILLPPVGTQRSIVAILSTYDDLIENNARRIQILDEMAKAIYREWFVEFRYPGHQDTPLVESTIGTLPSGWGVGSLQDLMILQRGFDLPRKIRSDGVVPVITATGQHGTHSDWAVRGPGVVTGRSGSLGRVMYIHEDFWPLNTTLWVKEFRAATPELAYFVLKSLDLAAYNSGAAVPTLNRNDISGHAMPLPPEPLVARFSAIAANNLGLARTLRAMNDNLHRIRDFLLPRLISGEIDVSDLAIDSSGLVA